MFDINTHPHVITGRLEQHIQVNTLNGYTLKDMYTHTDTAADTQFVTIAEVWDFHLVERLTNFRTLNKVLVINQGCQHQNTHRFITGLAFYFYSSLSVFLFPHQLAYTHSHMYAISLILPLPTSVLLNTFELKETLLLFSNLPYIVLPLRDLKSRPDHQLL